MIGSNTFQVTSKSEQLLADGQIRYAVGLSLAGSVNKSHLTLNFVTEIRDAAYAYKVGDIVDVSISPACGG